MEVRFVELTLGSQMRVFDEVFATKVDDDAIRITAVPQGCELPVSPGEVVMLDDGDLVEVELD